MGKRQGHAGGKASRTRTKPSEREELQGSSDSSGDSEKEEWGEKQNSKRPKERQAKTAGSNQAPRKSREEGEDFVQIATALRNAFPDQKNEVLAKMLLARVSTNTTDVASEDLSPPSGKKGGKAARGERSQERAQGAGDNKLADGQEVSKLRM